MSHKIHGMFGPCHSGGAQTSDAYLQKHAPEMSLSCAVWNTARPSRHTNLKPPLESRCRHLSNGGFSFVSWRGSAVLCAVQKVNFLKEFEVRLFCWPTPNQQVPSVLKQKKIFRLFPPCPPLSSSSNVIVAVAKWATPLGWVYRTLLEPWGHLTCKCCRICPLHVVGPGCCVIQPVSSVLLTGTANVN